MQKIAFILLFVISPVIFIQKSNAQIEKQLDSLCVLCQRNTSDSEKVYNLDKLAAYYYIYFISGWEEKSPDKQTVKNSERTNIASNRESQ